MHKIGQIAISESGKIGFHVFYDSAPYCCTFDMSAVIYIGAHSFGALQYSLF